MVSSGSVSSAFSKLVIPGCTIIEGVQPPKPSEEVVCEILDEASSTKDKESESRDRMSK